MVVSHVRSTIERTAERVLMLYDGQFQWQGSVDAFRTTDNPYVVQFRMGSLLGPMRCNRRSTDHHATQLS